MFNEEQKMLDVHIVGFKYRKSYIKRILNDGTSNEMEFEIALGAK